MSVSHAAQACPNVESTLSTSEYCVFIALFDYAGPNGECWPSVRTLVDQLRISERTVYYALAKLERLGVVKRHKTNGSSNHYSVLATPVEVFKRFFPRPTALVAPLHIVQVTPATTAVPPLQPQQYEVRTNEVIHQEVVISQPTQNELPIAVPLKLKTQRKPADEDELYAFAKTKGIPSDWAFDFWLFCEQNEWTRSQGTKILPLSNWKKHMVLYWRCGYLRKRD